MLILNRYVCLARLFSSGVLTSGASLLFLTWIASGAETPTDKASSDANGQTNAPVRLPAVIVTAQKEPESLAILPVSVTAVTHPTLEDADAHFVKDAAIYAPNVFMNEFTARKLSNPFFRGIGSSPNNPGVTTYIDGVPQLNANSSSIELLDLAQVEFVRGPQGALFGRNTVGGVINILSRRPSFTWTSEVEAEYGNFDYRDVRLAVSGPLLADRAAMSLVAGYSARDGFTRNDVTGHDLDSREGFFGKGQLLWTPWDNWEVRLILSGERDRDGDYALGDLAAIRERPFHVAHDFEGYTHRDILAPTLLVNRNGPAVDLAMSAGLVWWETRDLTDLDYTPIPAVTRDNHEKDLQFTDEFRIASAKDSPLNISDQFKLKWQAGISCFSQNYDQDALNSYSPGILYQPNEFGPGVPPSFSPANAQHAPRSTLDDVGLGAFLQATLVGWDKLDLSVGVHGDYEEKRADLNTFFTNPDPFLGPPTHLKPSTSFCEASPQFSLAWHFTPEKMAYATIGRGYKTGGFNPISPPGDEAYGQEYSWNYELGAKTEWCDGRFAVNVAAFYIRWDDLQLNLPSGAPGQFYIANAGSADSKGLELELRARPVKGWEVFGSAGVTDAHFLDGARAGHTDPFGVNSIVDVSGNRLIFTPEFTINGGMQYTWQVCRQVALYARGEVVVYGSYYYNPANTASQSSYSLADFRAGVRGSHWFAEGWVRNAFDTHYIPVAFEFPNGAFGGSGFVGENGAPVTYGVRAGLLF